ncbi:MAG: YceI family protein [Magnetococcales bacterium]|nr:YceI family protein [Magnetococcales bacterium]
MRKTGFIVAALIANMVWTGSSSVWAAEEQYKIDPAHSFVTFSIAHLGYSLLQGRFNKIEGTFTLESDQTTGAAIQITVQTDSIDSNHAERDKHLRSKDFLDVDKFPSAVFKSSRMVEKDGKSTVEGELTLHGVTRPVTFEARTIGAGPDPWGGFRRGYTGSLHIKRADYGIRYNLGQAAEEMDLGLYIEGIRQ